MSGWDCPHGIDGRYRRLGMRRCVLHGRFDFSKGNRTERKKTKVGDYSIRTIYDGRLEDAEQAI